MNSTRRCQYCGSEIPPEAIACVQCEGAIVSTPGVATPDLFSSVRRALSDKYEIVAEIGHGGNATVYQAIQKNLDRKIALKVLLPGLIHDAGYLERFHQEARSIAKLRHPNIVTIYDEGNIDGILFMAMEFLEGKDLHRLVKENGRLSVQDAVEMARCIATALDYAHGYGIIHRDVKSSNIIMTSPRTAVLTDFGIAQSPGTQLRTKSGSLLGTPEFMSPEQASGRQTDPRTDFYSLGVVLYHALSGRYPFQGDSPIGTIHKIICDDPVPISSLVSLPPAMEQGIEKCLIKDPVKRIGSGRELIELLTAAAPVRVPPAAATPRESRTQRPAVKTGEQQAARPSPEAPSTHVRRRQQRRGRVLARTLMFASLACLLLTGYVAWQRIPRQGAQAMPVTATMAPVPERKLVPYVIGASEEEAVKLLKREGFEIGAIRAVAVPDPAQRGRVDSQHPAHGSLAAPGTKVELLVGE